MEIGYMRVSKADGSQTTDLQLDALLAPESLVIIYAKTKHPGRRRTDHSSLRVSRLFVTVTR